MPTSERPAAVRRASRLALAIAVMAAAVPVAFARPDRAFAEGSDAPDVLLAVKASASNAMDHVLLVLDEPIDPASIPDPTDFTVTVNAVPMTVTDVDLGYQGLSGSPLVEGISTEGVAILALRWVAPPDPAPSEAPPVASEAPSQPELTPPPPDASAPPDAEIAVSYTPGTHPLRDAAGNQTAAFGPMAAIIFNDPIVAAFVDEGAGPDHLVLVAFAPIAPAIPAPEDFAVTIVPVEPLASGETIDPVTPLSVSRHHEDLGYGLLDLALPVSVKAGEEVYVTYVPSETGPVLQWESLDPIEIVALQAFVSVAATPTRETPIGTDVAVSPTDSLTGAQLVDLTFDNVTTEGTTTLVTSSGDPGVPGALALGDPPTYFDLSTTAGFTGSVEVCIHYGLIDFADESALRLIHEEGGVWVDVTTLLDPDADLICGSVTSFSPFAVVQPVGTYAVSGFFAPVDNEPTRNVVKAGAAIPVRFALGGDQGLDIFAVGHPRSRGIDCESGTPLDLIEETVTAGSSGLAYSPETGVYTYTWKTAKAWAGTCRELVVVLDDTSRLAATFAFR